MRRRVLLPFFPFVALIGSLLVPAGLARVQADCPVAAVINDGSVSGNARAPIHNFRFERAVYLITPGEMTAAGIGTGGVGGIGWTYAVASGLTAMAPLKIYLQETTDTTNTKSTTWATAITGMTLVHDATTTLPATAGAFDLTFSTGSFPHTAGQGLYIAFDWGLYSGTLATATQVLCNQTGLIGGLKGQQSNTAAPTTLAVSNFRPETRLLVPVPATNVSVDFLISMGALPVGLTGPQAIQATVFQYGDTDLTNTPVTLNITGAETFTSNVNIPSLSRCGTFGSVVTFAAFTPSVVGADTVSASVPADAVPANDSLSLPLDVTVNRYSYQHSGVPADGGVGFTGAAGGEFLARFSFNAPTQIDSVDVNFFAVTATTYRVSIRADDGAGNPGAALYLDAADRSVASSGLTTITLPSPVPIGAGNVFVGIRQTNTTNCSFSFNSEFPVRPDTFFFSTTPAAGPWTDFSPGTLFQLNVGLTEGNCLVPLGVDVTPDGPTHVACNAVVNLTAGTTGGTGPKTYQWTENGANIPGATASSYLASHAAGTFTYNSKVSDAGGCIAALDPSSSSVTWGPTATVSGSASICAGESTEIQAALTGTGPWNVTWSDGFVQNGVAASPATRNVSPGTTTVYVVSTVSDASCSGTSGGSASVTVDPFPQETAPGPSPAAQLNWSSDDTLTWPANPNATTYTVYRGARADLPSLLSAATDSCTRFQGAATSAGGLTEVPTSGEFFWYLVTGASAAGCEGTAGNGRIVNSSGSCL